MMYGSNPQDQFNLPEDIVALAETSANKVLDFVFNENAAFINAVMVHPDMSQVQKNQLVSAAVSRWGMLQSDLGVYTEYRKRKARAEEFERHASNTIPGNPVYAGNPYQLGGYLSPSVSTLNPLMNTGHPPRSNMFAGTHLQPSDEFVFDYDGRQFTGQLIRDVSTKIEGIVIGGLRYHVSSVLNDDECNDAVALVIELPYNYHPDIDYPTFMEQVLPCLLEKMGVGSDELKLSWTIRSTKNGGSVFYVDMAPDQDSLDHESFSDLLHGHLNSAVLYDQYFDVPEVE